MCVVPYFCLKQLRCLLMLPDRVLCDFWYHPYHRYPHQRVRPPNRAVAAAYSSKDQGVRVASWHAYPSAYILLNIYCSLPAGWLIPIAIFFVISFPPVCPEHVIWQLLAHKDAVVWTRDYRHSLRSRLGSVGWLRYHCSWNFRRRNWQFLVRLAWPLLIRSLMRSATARSGIAVDQEARNSKRPSSSTAASPRLSGKEASRSH